jgi:formamidopyrimidine-DNA glycosylase
MPELPEVQTVVSDLNQKIKGDVITDFWSEWPKAIKGKSLAAFKKEIIGRKIVGARRLGKNMFLDLSGGKTLYLHLKMTGHLLIKEQETKNNNQYFSDRVNQYIRHRWTLKTKNQKLKTIDFSDVRKFAKIVLDDTAKIAALPEIKALGVDAVSAEFTFKKFNELLECKPKMLIGILLMDQSLIAGIGNIYRSEILFAAGVLPERKNETLSIEERKKVFKETGKILQKAIKMRGTSDSDYRDTSGAPGTFQTVLRVYRKDGEKCPKCDTIIVRKKMAQRSVFFCPGCQK